MSHTPRVFVAPPLGPGPLAVRGSDAKHLAVVMRLRPGDEFLGFAGDGREWRATVTSVDRDTVLATVGELARQEAAPAVILETWIGVVRANRLDDAIEKCVEAGADIIRPVVCEFSQRSEVSSPAKTERWLRIAREAAEQAGRLFVPVVEPPVTLTTALERLHGAIVFGHASGQAAGELAPLLPRLGAVAWLVGPEGGLSEPELAALKRRGALPLALGPYILRTETAAVVGTAVLRSLTAGD